MPRPGGTHESSRRDGPAAARRPRPGQSTSSEWLSTILGATKGQASARSLVRCRAARTRREPGQDGADPRPTSSPDTPAGPSPPHPSANAPTFDAWMEVSTRDSIWPSVLPAAALRELLRGTQYQTNHDRVSGRRQLYRRPFSLIHPPSWVPVL